ncbi:Hypothetical predicted protein [Lecanosticta acicola]|uniref:Uncharacterized protein n=1 Tax=Lecanosticta acicola TaxID=111012 RepID=A0AAI8Z8A6_9PEZI|nr:Hypothetical predicted protein [Lecanosticta acicola]
MADPLEAVACSGARPPTQPAPQRKASKVRRLFTKTSDSSEHLQPTVGLQPQPPTIEDLEELLKRLDTLNVGVQLEPRGPGPGELPPGFYTIRLAPGRPAPERHLERPATKGEVLDLKRRVEALEREEQKRKSAAAMERRI